MKCKERSASKNLMDNLIKLSKYDPKGYWKLVDRLGGRKKTVRGNFDLGSWFNHFNDLLNTIAELDVGFN